MPWLASSKRPIRWRDRPGERTLLVAEQLAFEQAGRNGGAIQLDERVRLARAEVVHGARDQLLAGAGFTVDQDGRIGRRHDFDLPQNVPESFAAADDLLEIQLAADFVLEVDLLLHQLVLELGDLAIRRGVLHRNRNLAADLLEKLDIVIGKGVLTHRAERQHPEHAFVADERHPAQGVRAFERDDAVGGDRVPVHVRLAGATRRRVITDLLTSPVNGPS